jgi:uncharacterized repeat protein (TIGR03803 family)
MKTFKVLFILAALTLLGASAFAQARYTIIHHFAGGANDGRGPKGGLAVSGSILYGMTYYGGSNDRGTVFKINTDGTGFAVLHSFAGGVTDGAEPYGSLTLSGSTLYGVTSGGGSNDRGTVFKINTDGTGFALLHAFVGEAADGWGPCGSLTLSGSMLYGTTCGGGSNGRGTVFTINTDGTGFALLHSFDASGYIGSTPGADPIGSLTLVGSVLYGMANASRYGAPGISMFKLNTDGTGFAQLAGFGASSPSITQGEGLTLVDSTFFGMGYPHHLDSGALFRINMAGTGYTVLHRFRYDDYPQGSPVSSGSTLYGMSSGTVFQVNTDGAGFALQHLFPVDLADGREACGSLTFSGNNLYGMTSMGGHFGHGVVFALIPNAPYISTSPSSQTVAAGDSATFTVSVSGPTPLANQWQRQVPGSTTWTDLSDSATYRGTGTATLTVNSISAAMNGDLFRCVSTNSYGTDTSYTATIVVPDPLTVSTFAGQHGQRGSSDGSGSSAQFYYPTDVATDSAGNVYVADTSNHTIRKITPAGVVSTVAGYAGASGTVDGADTVARFNHPSGVTADGAGNLYVSDTDNDTIRKITSAGVVSTLAGTAGASGYVDSTGTAARFYCPSGIVADASGNLYVSDSYNFSIRKITPAGLVTTLAGGAGVSGYVDGVGTAARFSVPEGLAISSDGILFVADGCNSSIRRVNLSTGSVVTWSGSADQCGSADGPVSIARFHYPCGVAVDNAGNLYVADTDNNTIRAINSLGVVTTIAGQAGTWGSADGVGSSARFFYPTSIAVDSTGSLFIVDTDNDTIRLGIYPAAPTITAQPQSQTLTAGTSVQFTVTASAKPAPAYQWNFNGAAISGATASTYSLSSVQTTSAGNYSVTVTNSSGSVTSNTATLTVNAAVAPSSGGGGAVEPWTVLALAILTLIRCPTRRCAH